MGFFADIKGTTVVDFVLNRLGVRLKDSSGNLLVRNNADNADAEITASKVNVSGDSLVINSDAGESGSDYKITLARPTSGMSASYTLTFPPDDGAPGQLPATDGSGNLSWVSAGSTADCLHTHKTSLAFGDSSPVTMFTLPANAEIKRVSVIVDTPFNGTSPTLSVGIVGTTSKYMPTTGVNLKGTAKDDWRYHPNEIPSGSPENIIGTYAPDSSSAGAARIEVEYTTPA